MPSLPGDVSHVANFFIEGLFSKGHGNGNSFALPTHEPIMILRDPSGGSSCESYEYVQSTIRLVDEETEADLDIEVEGNLEGTIE